MAVGNWPQLYAESLADVRDVAEEIRQRPRRLYEVNKLGATIGNKRIGVPWIAVQCQAHARHHGLLVNVETATTPVNDFHQPHVSVNSSIRSPRWRRVLDGRCSGGHCQQAR